MKYNFPKLFLFVYDLNATVPASLNNLSYSLEGFTVAFFPQS